MQFTQPKTKIISKPQTAVDYESVSSLQWPLIRLRHHFLSTLRGESLDQVGSLQLRNVATIAESDNVDAFVRPFDEDTLAFGDFAVVGKNVVAVEIVLRKGDHATAALVLEFLHIRGVPTGCNKGQPRGHALAFGS